MVVKKVYSYSCDELATCLETYKINHPNKVYIPYVSFCLEMCANCIDRLDVSCPYAKSRFNGVLLYLPEPNKNVKGGVL